MKNKTTNCTDTGLYRSFLELLKTNTEYIKNIDRAYQNMFAQETTETIVNCSKSFIKSFNSFSINDKINNIMNVKNDLLTYDLILKTLTDLKILSLKQVSNVGLIIAKINSQINGYERKLNEMKNE